MFMHNALQALAAALLATASAPGLATTLINNANGIQADDSGTIVRFDGFLIGDDGKVSQVLKTGDARPVADTVVDVGGRTVLPGLIDAHGHIMGLGEAALSLDLVGTGSIEEFKQRLRDYAASHPDLPWIVGRGWNQELWPIKAFPTSADIDQVVADRPVWLERVDGHAAIANSKAMELAGYGPATAVPSGGRVERGLFVDSAMELVAKAIPEATPAMNDSMLAEAQKALLAVGIVGAADMGTDVDDWQAYQRAGRAGTLKVRIFSYAAGLSNWRIIHDGTPTGWTFGDRLALVGTKLYADGALGSRGAFLKEPYADKPDTRGLSLIDSDALYGQAYEVSEGGGQLAVHAIGDAANAQVIGVFEKIGDTYGRYHRPRIEHFQVVAPADIARLKPAGIVASMQPTHQTSDRLMAEARLGPKRLDGSYAWASVLKAGIPLAFGSDFPVESPNPFHGLSAAISREDLEGQPPGGWRPEEKVTLGQAIHGFTRGAAFAGFTEKTMGAIEPGHWADFIVVDRDPTKVDAQSLGQTKVIETWIGGEKVFTSGPTTPVR